MLLAESETSTMDHSVGTDRVLRQRQEVVQRSMGVLKTTRDCVTLEQQHRKSLCRKKRVTFDMKPQIHTIPSRISAYERTPTSASSDPRKPLRPPTLLHRGQQHQQHSPIIPSRPGNNVTSRDRYRVGAANLGTRRIIDLFGSSSDTVAASFNTRVTNTGSDEARRNHHQYSFDLSGSRRTLPQPEVSTEGAPSPAYSYAHQTLSRAAANLKQITAALGEDIASDERQQTPLGDTGITHNGPSTSIASEVIGRSNPVHSSFSMLGQTGTPTNRSQPAHNGVHNSVFPGTRSSQSYLQHAMGSTTDNGSQQAHNGVHNIGFPGTRNSQSYLQHAMGLTTSSNQPVNKYSSSVGGGIRVASLGKFPNTSDVLNSLPTVNSEPIKLHNRYISAANMDKTGTTHDTTNQLNGYSVVTDLNNNSSTLSRTPSRCSTIDSYVIGSDRDVSSPLDIRKLDDDTTGTNSRPIGIAGNGRAYGQLATPPSRAWEGTDVRATSLQVSPLRTGSLPRAYGQNRLPSYSLARQRSFSNSGRNGNT